MSARDTRERWQQFWARVDAETKAEKLSQAALVELSRYYRSLQAEERQTIDAVLSEWVVSDNESKRFDALALVDEHRIRSALPALEELRRKLDKSREPSAPFEKAKVDLIITSLT